MQTGVQRHVRVPVRIRAVRVDRPALRVRGIHDWIREGNLETVAHANTKAGVTSIATAASHVPAVRAPHKRFKSH